MSDARRYAMQYDPIQGQGRDSRALQSWKSGQNDRVYAPRDTRKRSIAAERLLRCRPTFSKSLMVSVAVSKLGCSPLFFVEPGVKVDGRYTGTCY